MHSKVIAILPEDFIHNINDGVFVTSDQGQYLFANQRLAQIYGFSDSAELMRHFKDIGSELYVEPGRRAEFKKILKQNKRIENFESQVRRKDGTLIWIRETSWRNGETYTGTVSDITAEHRYYHDELTGLPKRFLFEKKLQELLDLNIKDLGLMLLEVQEYIDSKNIEGESTMEQMILKMAEYFRQQASPEMILARIEQNQFVFLCPGATQVKMLSFISKIQKLRALNFKFEDSHFSFNEFRLGLMLNPASQNLTAQQALSYVQLACRHAKPANHFHAFYEPAMGVDYRKQTELVSQLRAAVDQKNIHKEFYLVFHPQFNLKDQTMSGVETLIRWRKADGEEVSPMTFIPIAESKGLIHSIGFWVMEEAFKVLRQWQKQKRDWKMSVNVSVAQFLQEDFVERVLNILEKTKVDPTQIVLEITESGEIPESKIEKLNQSIKTFQELGMEISHDDFGAGQSFEHLLRLSMNELKMDKSFWDSAHAEKLLKMIATLSQDLRVRLVVEGVENTQQLEALKALGIDLVVQGYFFSKPLTLDKLEAFVLETRGRTV